MTHRVTSEWVTFKILLYSYQFQTQVTKLQMIERSLTSYISGHNTVNSKHNQANNINKHVSMSIYLQLTEIFSDKFFMTYM